MLFDFDEHTQLYIFSLEEYEYKMPFTLMLDSKQYVRAADVDRDLLAIVKEWYSQLDAVNKEKVIINYRQLKTS